MQRNILGSFYCDCYDTGHVRGFKKEVILYALISKYKLWEVNICESLNYGHRYTCTDNTATARPCTKSRKTECNGEEYLPKAL